MGPIAHYRTMDSENTSALHLVLTGDPTLFAIVQLSLLVSLSAVAFATIIGVPFGAWLALSRFPADDRPSSSF